MLIRSIHNFYVRVRSSMIDLEVCRNGNYWLFILGVNNSGTTVLSNLLETHPKIRALPAEGQLLTTAFPRPDLVGVERLWSSRQDIFRWNEKQDPKPALLAKKDWLKKYSKNTGILLEKSPPNTLRSLWLQKNFNPSRFISIIRSPYAVCEGIRRRKNYSIEQAAQHWRDANECLIHDIKSINKHLLIKYEDLVQNPIAILNIIKDFLELDSGFEDSFLDEVKAHSIEGQTSGLNNMNDLSVQRLSKEDKEAINRICGDIMLEFGYDPIH